MLRASCALVNALHAVYWHNLAHAVHVYDKRRVENRWKRRQIQPPKAAQALMRVPQPQTYCGYARCGSASCLGFQRREKRRRAAEHERFLKTHAPVLLAISDGATPELRSQLRMFFLEMAARTHRPAIRRRLSFGLAGQSPARMRDCIRGSSLAPRVSATLPSPRPARRQFPEHARPIPHQTKSREGHASASCCARWTKHKTSSQTDSKKHAQSAAQEKTLPHAFTGGASFSEFDYRRPAQTLAIATAYRSIGRIRRSEAANWSALYAEGFSSCRKSSLMAARTSSALLGFASLL